MKIVPTILIPRLKCPSGGFGSFNAVEIRTADIGKPSQFHSGGGAKCEARAGWRSAAALESADHRSKGNGNALERTRFQHSARTSLDIPRRSHFALQTSHLSITLAKMFSSLKMNGPFDCGIEPV